MNVTLLTFRSVERSKEVLTWLLELISSDPEPMIRHSVLRMLVDKPPCDRNGKHAAPPTGGGDGVDPLASEDLVEKLWTLMK